jgi:hypothetical protein
MAKYKIGAAAAGVLLCAALVAFAQPEPAPQTPPPATPAPGTPPPTSDALTADEVQKLFSGNTEITTALKRGVPTGREYKSYHLPDGTYRLVEKTGQKGGGSWFVDPLGRHCFRIEGKDKTKCDVIAREGDHFIRLRDGERRGQMSIQKGNPFGL